MSPPGPQATDRDFIAELLEALPPDARQAAQDVLWRFAGERVYLRAETAAKRRRAALAMLRNGMTRAQAQESLCIQFGIDQDAARRDVRLALDRRSRPGDAAKISGSSKFTARVSD